jgi:hypothetical protein
VGVMRRVRARKVDSANGEIHFILEEPQASEHSEHFKDYDVSEIKKASRKEAAKPLVLLREE